MITGNTLIAHIKADPPRIDGNVDSETEKDGHQDMALTPRTEASTPESGGEYTTYICDSDRRSNSEKSSEDETYGERTLQRHMSQTDDHIQLLDRNGDLNEVAGSQSMLSQELIDHDHDETRDLGLPRGSSSKTSIGIAKRIGLLSNSQEELPSSQETTHSQEPLSGLDLLTHVGIKEAHKIPSFSTETKPSTDSSSNKATSFSANPTKPREHEGFGSLLDAVAKITEQEASQEYSMDWRTASTTTAFNTTKTKTTIPKRIGQKRKIARMLPTSKRLGPAAKQRKSEGQKTKERLRRERIEQEKEKAQATANRAAMIAERTISDPAIAKKLLLSMALARENPRSVPQTLRGKGHVVQEGFFWVSKTTVGSIQISLPFNVQLISQYSPPPTPSFDNSGSLSSSRDRIEEPYGRVLRIVYKSMSIKATTGFQ